MPIITKIHKEPIGEFTIKFSLRNFLFEIEYPTSDMEIHNKLTNQVIVRNHQLKTWKDVEAELQSIVEQFKTKALMTRKVIIIQLQTSESNYQFEDRNDWFGKITTEQKAYDHMSDAEGFKLKWYVAEEYKYPKSSYIMGKEYLRYRIIETNKNNNRRNYYMNHDATNILPQLLRDDEGGKVRVFDYTDALYQFLQEMQESVESMLHRMIDYFSIEPDKFLSNVESQVKLLPNAREDTDSRA